MGVVYIWTMWSGRISCKQYAGEYFLPYIVYISYRQAARDALIIESLVQTLTGCPQWPKAHSSTVPQMLLDRLSTSIPLITYVIAAFDRL